MEERHPRLVRQGWRFLLHSLSQSYVLFFLFSHSCWLTDKLKSSRHFYNVQRFANRENSDPYSIITAGIVCDIEVHRFAFQCATSCSASFFTFSVVLTGLLMKIGNEPPNTGRIWLLKIYSMHAQGLIPNQQQMKANSYLQRSITGCLSKWWIFKLVYKKAASNLH